MKALQLNFLGAVARNGSLSFFEALDLCVGKNQMCHLSVGKVVLKYALAKFFL